MDPKELMEELKGKGVEIALIKRDEGLVYSTFAMEDPAPYIAQYLANNAQLLMSQLEDEVREIELSFEGRIAMVFPTDTHVLLGVLKSKEDKKVLREYVARIKELLAPPQGG